MKIYWGIFCIKYWKCAIINMIPMLCCLELIANSAIRAYAILGLINDDSNNKRLPLDKSLDLP